MIDFEVRMDDGMMLLILVVRYDLLELVWYFVKVGVKVNSVDN